MAVALDGKEITTVEGLARAGELALLQQAFLEAFAFQCGYCTPGFLMAALVLLDRLKRAPVAKAALDAEIELTCGAHVCRCTGYRRYHEAIRSVVAARRGLTTG
jgi:aerobic-type carbon monoxide dehydrogenase small subunit (CoxS/CutS family)